MSSAEEEAIHAEAERQAASRRSRSCGNNAADHRWHQGVDVPAHPLSCRDCGAYWDPRGEIRVWVLRCDALEQELRMLNDRRGQ